LKKKREGGGIRPWKKAGASWKRVMFEKGGHPAGIDGSLGVVVEKGENGGR